MSSPLTLRSPSSLPTTQPSPSLPPPPLRWLAGSWNVTHSTLPMWKKSRNVRITYTPMPNTSPPQIDDLVSYQPLDSTKLKTVHGVDKPFDVAPPNTASSGAEDGDQGDTEKASLGYNWRGKGWLVIAGSKWEILGYGDEEEQGREEGEGGATQAEKNQFVVTYFAKTMFTPAGVDLYSRKGNLKPQTVEKIKAALAGLGGEVAKLADHMFEVKMDGDRTD